MKKTPKNLSIFVKSNEDFSLFEKLTIDEVTNFCLNQIDFIISDLRKKELIITYSEFHKELQSVLYEAKVTIYFFKNFENPLSKVFINSMNNLRGQIKQYFGFKFADLISWHEPNIIDQFFGEKVMPKMEFNAFKPIIKNEDKKIRKRKDEPLWYYVFQEIYSGNISVIKENNSLSYFYKGKEFQNPTKLGEHLSELRGKTQSTIRLYFTESLGVVNKGEKNIFTKKKKLKIMKLMENKENKMCSYFQNKLDELIGTN